jgi:hypothetical protein
MADLTREEIEELIIALQGVVEDGEEHLDFERVHRDSLRALRQLLSATEWKPIDEAPNKKLLLYAPPERLYENPVGLNGEYKARRPAEYTWATHWMPLPLPPSPLIEGER